MFKGIKDKIAQFLAKKKYRSANGDILNTQFTYCMFIIAVLLIFGSQSATALTIPWNKEGKFVKIQKQMFTSEEPIELPDGNVAFPPDYVLNTKTYKLEKTDKKYFSGIKLKDGTILTAKPIADYPYTDWNLPSEINSYLRDNKNINLYKDYDGFRELSKKKQLEIMLQYIKDDPEILKKYNDYVDKFEKSMYGIISNQKTGEYRQVGKMQVRREDTKQFLLNDGKVLITGGLVEWDNSIPEEQMRKIIGESQRAVEIYDPKTEKFTLRSKTKNYSGDLIFLAIKLNDDKFFTTSSWKPTGITYYFYDPHKNTLSEEKPFPKEYGSNLNRFTKLNDDRIVFFVNLFNSKFKETGIQFIDLIRYMSRVYYDTDQIIIYDPVKDEFSYGGKLKRRRGEQPNFITTTLKDGRVLILGGREFGKIIIPGKYVGSAEIYNPDTKKSKIIGKPKYPYRNYSWYTKMLVLSDGRVLIYEFMGNAYLPAYQMQIEKVEMYIPKVKNK